MLVHAAGFSFTLAGLAGKRLSNRQSLSYSSSIEGFTCNTCGRKDCKISHNVMTENQKTPESPRRGVFSLNKWANECRHIDVGWIPGFWVGMSLLGRFERRAKWLWKQVESLWTLIWRRKSLQRTWNASPPRLNSSFASTSMALFEFVAFVMKTFSSKVFLHQRCLNFHTLFIEKFFNALAHSHVFQAETRSNWKHNVVKWQAHHAHSISSSWTIAAMFSSRVSDSLERWGPVQGGRDAAA